MKKAAFLALAGALVGYTLATLLAAYLRFTAGTVSLGPGARVFFLPALSGDVYCNILRGLTCMGVVSALVINRVAKPKLTIRPVTVVLLLFCCAMTIFAHDRITDSLWMQGL